MTKNDKIHLEDFLAKVRSNIKEYEQNDLLKPHPLISLSDLETSSFYSQCQSFLSWNAQFDRLGLIKDMKQFDKTNTGKIKIYHLINILKFKLRAFSEDTLKALQFDLECLSNDGMIDYEEFVSIAFKST